jgi:hypothetical protein
MLDRPAEEVVAEIEHVVRVHTRAKVVLLYLLGAVIVDDVGDAYIAAIDTRPSALRTSAVATSRIAEALDASEVRRQVVILDCVIVGERSGAVAGVRTPADVRHDVRTVTRQLGRRRGVIVAADAMQPRPVHAPPATTFTSDVVLGLRSGDADVDGDGRVTASDLLDFAWHAVRRGAPERDIDIEAVGLHSDIVVARVPPVPLVAPSSPAGAAGPAPSDDTHAKDSRADRPFDDDVQFTVYRPGHVLPERWHPLLAFAHTSTPFVDDDGRDIDPIEEVASQARAVLADEATTAQRVATDSAQRLYRGSELLFEPWLEIGEVNPSLSWLRWQEPVHRVEFRVRVPAAALDRRVAGGVRVFLGSVLVGEVTFRIPVRAAVDRPGPPTAREPGVRYRQIFASYSHRDADVVAAVEHYVTVTGDRYLTHARALRSGEVWQPRIAELIDSADLFQLFWSRNAMESPFVRQEWEHALRLGRAGFIRPVYWEDPLPADEARQLPPEALRRLHFSRLHRPGRVRAGTTGPTHTSRREPPAGSRPRPDIAPPPPVRMEPPDPAAAGDACTRGPAARPDRAAEARRAPHGARRHAGRPSTRRPALVWVIGALVIIGLVYGGILLFDAVYR